MEFSVVSQSVCYIPALFFFFLARRSGWRGPSQLGPREAGRKVTPCGGKGGWLKPSERVMYPVSKGNPWSCFHRVSCPRHSRSLQLCSLGCSTRFHCSFPFPIFFHLNCKWVKVYSEHCHETRSWMSLLNGITQSY